MTHAQISPTGRRPDFAASYHARKQSHAPLFTVTNKHLLKAAADAAKALALNPKERQVLTELALCFGGQQLAAGLLCWPSNAHLSARTNIPERTLSRVLSGLCRQGLIVARESANGKRFPIKNRKGEIVDARGFDLTPLYARAPDFAARCKEIEVETKLCRQLRGDVTAARNAVRDLCAADGAGLLIKIAARLDALPYPLPRCATSLELAAAAESLRHPGRRRPRHSLCRVRIVGNDGLCLPKWPTLRARHKIPYRRLQARSERRYRDAAFSRKRRLRRK